MRTLIPAAFLGLTALSACSGSAEPEPVSDDEAAREVASRICTVLKKGGQECEHSGTQAKALDHSISVKAMQVHIVEVGSSATMELEYSFKMDGKDLPALHAKAVGSGLSKEEARKKAASDWASVYGAAIADRLIHDGKLHVLQALQDDQAPPPAFEAGEWVAYPGWMHFQGTMAEKKTIMVDELLVAMEPAFKNWETTEGSTHAALVSIAFRAGFAPETECTLDGKPSKALCDLALTYDWPEPGQSYIVKQYFVLTPGPLPGDHKRKPPPSAEDAAPADGDAAPTTGATGASHEGH